MCTLISTLGVSAPLQLQSKLACACRSAHWAFLQGVMYSHRSNFLHALLVAFKDVIGLGSSSCFYAIVPMFHANSWGLVFAAPMTGARLVLPGETTVIRFATNKLTHNAGQMAILMCSIHTARLGRNMSDVTLCPFLGQNLGPVPTTRAHCIRSHFTTHNARMHL